MRRLLIVALEAPFARDPGMCLRQGAVRRPAQTQRALGATRSTPCALGYRRPPFVASRAPPPHASPQGRVDSIRSKSAIASLVPLGRDGREAARQVVAGPHAPTRAERAAAPRGAVMDRSSPFVLRVIAAAPPDQPVAHHRHAARRERPVLLAMPVARELRPQRVQGSFWRHAVPRAVGTTGSLGSPGADGNPPLVAFGAPPPDLPAASVRERFHIHGVVARRVPFAPQLRIGREPGLRPHLTGALFADLRQVLRRQEWQHVPPSVQGIAKPPDRLGPREHAPQRDEAQARERREVALPDVSGDRGRLRSHESAECYYGRSAPSRSGDRRTLAPP